MRSRKKFLVSLGVRVKVWQRTYLRPMLSGVYVKVPRSTILYLSSVEISLQLGFVEVLN